MKNLLLVATFVLGLATTQIFDYVNVKSAFANDDTLACDYTQVQATINNNKLGHNKFGNNVQQLLTTGWKIIDFERNNNKWEYLLERCQ
jgi:hypothetical protein